jgi:PBSX family phage terminase large subunit
MEFKDWGGKALDFIDKSLEEDAFINILEGSVRSGKTVAMIPKWLNYIMTGPPGLLLMTGVSKDTIYDNVLDDLFDTIGEERYHYNRNTGDIIITWYDDTGERTRRIKVIGAKDEGSEKFLRGKTLAGAYCDELTLMPERFFKQLLNRLSVPGAKLYATTNPDSPMHYLYREFITDERKLSNGLMSVVHFELDDNPNLDEEYKTNIRSSYSGMWFKRMILGLWVLAEGVIYDMFSDDHLFDDAEFTNTIKSTCRRYIACDYGTKNPMVFLDIYDDGDTIWIPDMYYWDSRKEQRQKTDAQYADDLEKMVGEEHPDFIVIDPSAASFKIECQGRGFRVKDADNSVNDGIRIVAKLLTKKKIRIHRTRCQPMIDEFQSYVWDERAARTGEEKPVKQADHAMDALRYYVHTMLPKWRRRE